MKLDEKRERKPRQQSKTQEEWIIEERKRRSEQAKSRRSGATKAKKRPRASDAQASKSEQPPGKKRRIERGDVGHQETPTRAQSAGEAKKTAGKRVQVATKGEKKGAKKGAKGKKQVKAEPVESATPRNKTPVGQMHDDSTSSSSQSPQQPEPTQRASKKRVAPQQKPPETEPAGEEKGFERYVPIERHPIRGGGEAGTDAPKPAKINVTTLLVQFKTEAEVDRTYEQWTPAAKQHFLTSIGGIGKTHSILDLSNVDVYDLEYTDDLSENPSEADVHVRAIEEQVERLREEHSQTKVALVGWGRSCLSTLGALPCVADKLTCVVNIAFHESEIAKLDEQALQTVSNYNVPIVFVVGGGEMAGWTGGGVAAVNELRALLQMPTGIIVVENVSEELLVPIHMLRSATSDQALVNGRIISSITQFIKETLEDQKKRGSAAKAKRARATSVGKKRGGN